jgi:hypothetical protein
VDLMNICDFGVDPIKNMGATADFRFSDFTSFIFSSETNQPM